jgi:GNAT superfamily N-acetyltransferase
MTSVNVRPVGAPGDLGWMVMVHGELYAKEFGWDASMEALVARIVADFAAAEDDVRKACWIAELDGARVGCVLCVSATPDTAQLRVLLVHPDARGRGLGGRLVDACVDHARATGYTRVRLWTNDVLEAARRIYLDRGFVLVDQQPHHSFGVDLVGQTYELGLGRSSGHR